MPPRSRDLPAANDRPRPQLAQDLDLHVKHQFAQLEKAISSVIGESDELRASVRKREDRADRSLEELSDTIRLFAVFAQVYDSAVTKLVTPQDHRRRSQALRKIQYELFVLRRLVEQRWSRDLWRLLRLADRWCHAYLTRLITAAPEAAPPGALKRRPVVTNEAGGGAAADAWAAPREIRNWCLTFFESEHHIRLSTFAYNRNPTIGLPLIHADEPHHWLGLAHEIGHFVFNNTEVSVDGAWVPLELHIRQSIFGGLAAKYLGGGGQQPPVRDDEACLGIANSIPLWCTWAEELFADILGSVTLGPAYVESLTLYISPTLADSSALLADDGDHPMACLRPIFQLLVHLMLLQTKGGGADEALRGEMAGLAARWFDYCEDQLWEGSAPSAGAAPATHDLSTPQGILARLGAWRTYGPQPNGRVPLPVLLDQVKEVSEAFAKVLSGLPMYDAAAHARARQLAAAMQLRGRAFKEAVQLEDFYLFLVAQWYVEGPRPEFDQTQQKRWLEHTDSLGEPVAKSARLLLKFSDSRGFAAAQALIEPLFRRGKNGAGWDTVQEAWQAYDARRQHAYTQAADWLLNMPLATESPASGYVTCGIGLSPGCVSER